jgi:hypothetical protein
VKQEEEEEEPQKKARELSVYIPAVARPNCSAADMCPRAYSDDWGALAGVALAAIAAAARTIADCEAEVPSLASLADGPWDDSLAAGIRRRLALPGPRPRLTVPLGAAAVGTASVGSAGARGTVTGTDGSKGTRCGDGSLKCMP